MKDPIKKERQIQKRKQTKSPKDKQETRQY